MEFLPIRLVDVLTILALLFSPLFAVLVTVWLQNRKERRGSKLWVFHTLIGSRHAPLADNNIRALNLIDVIYHDAPAVRRLWREYFEMLSNEGLNNPQGWATRQTKNLELIKAMANELNYGEAITHLDVTRVYYPVALDTQARRNQEISDELLRFFRAMAQALQNQQQQTPNQPPT